MSSKPTTDSCSGTRIPSARAASSAPRAWVSEAAKIAVGRSGSDRSSEAEDLPDWLEGLTLEGMHAFDRRWDVRVEDGAVSVEPSVSG